MDNTYRKQAEELLEKLTLEEKARLCGGKDFWTLHGIERLGIPSIMVTDGPHGLRKQSGASDHLGLNKSVKATCFPPACLTAASWDPEAINEMGRAMGEECIQEDVAVILGPGVNIKRSPLCGRNFEYFSEDPYLAGKMAASLTKGIQSKGIGTSLKHYACNSQEKARLTSNSVLDERTLREIYLPAFEETVKEAQPDTVMCSYNMVNGVYACQNDKLLNRILRDEWGFNGLVMTDWGAMSDRVKAIAAGLDLEMPGPCRENEEALVNAVKDGVLDEKILDKACLRILSTILKAEEIKAKSYDVEAHHALARKMAASSMILLENRDSILPLSKKGSYALIGTFAKTPRYQGAGSSKINPHKIDSPYEELEQKGFTLSYAEGYDHVSGETDEAKLKEAITVSEGKDAVIVFAGLPDSYESEGFDRTTLTLPEGHNRLIKTLVEKGRKVIVVLLCGSPVVMPWKDEVSAILLAYLGGEATGGATSDILSGAVSPSGCLPETFPEKLEDTPCYGNFANEDSRNMLYKECIMVGYRWYDWKKLPVAYPFGHGLSYTTFEYSKPKYENGVFSVSVKNTGCVDSAHTVQLYIGMKNSNIFRAVRELKGFKKVFIKKGEELTVSIPLDERAFSYYDTRTDSWQIESGIYTLEAGSSSRDLRVSVEVERNGNDTPCSLITAETINASDDKYSLLFAGSIPLVEKSDIITVDSSIGDALKTQGGKEILKPIIDKATENADPSDDVSNMMMAMLMDSPMRIMWMFKRDSNLAEVKDMIDKINKINRK